MWACVFDCLRSVFAIEEPDLLLPHPIAVVAGTNAIVTLDTGFALLPSSVLTIYTDRSRLASGRIKAR